MIKIKPGVNAKGLHPETILAIMVAAPIFEAHGVDCVVTSLLEGPHKFGSRHFDGFAVDFRTRDLTNPAKVSVATTMKDALDNQYDVVLEQTHLHVEFDPR